MRRCEADLCGYYVPCTTSVPGRSRLRISYCQYSRFSCLHIKRVHCCECCSWNIAGLNRTTPLFIMILNFCARMFYSRMGNKTFVTRSHLTYRCPRKDTELLRVNVCFCLTNSLYEALRVSNAMSQVSVSIKLLWVGTNAFVSHRMWNFDVKNSFPSK